MKIQVLGMLLAFSISNASAQDAAAPRAATPKEEQAVLETLKGRLKDPDSAKISGTKVSADGKTVCGFKC